MRALTISSLFHKKALHKHACVGLLLFSVFSTPVAFARTSLDPLIGQQWFLDPLGLETAWNVTTGSRDIVVAVLDTGVDVNHPDLAGNIWVNGDEVAGDGIDNDHNGFVDDVHGWDFVDNDATPLPDLNKEFNKDAVHHGTAIAGVIGAIGDNGQGIAGINWRVKIMPIRILDNVGSGNSLDANAAVAYAHQNGADVISLSFSGFEFDHRFRDTLQGAHNDGVVVVAAMGNDSKQGGVDADVQPVYPACFRADDGSDLVIGVAATDPQKKKASFSNYGANCTALAAPGVGIFSTLFHEPSAELFSQPYGGLFSGTSLAVPMVSGAVALIKAAYPVLSPKQIKLALQLSVDSVDQHNTVAAGKLGAGVLNIGRAMQIAGEFSHSLLGSEVSVPEPVLVPEPSAPPIIVVAPEQGRAPEITVLSPQGIVQSTFLAFEESYLGGVRLAVDDLDGDGVPEIVAVPGPGHAPVVRLFEQDGTLIRELVIPQQALLSGWFVTTADVDRDGTPDLAISSDRIGSPEIHLLSTEGKRLGSFLPPEHRQSASMRIAGGDVDGDGFDEFVLSFGSGPPELFVYETDGTRVRQFLAYDKGYDKGVFVSVGDLNHDGIAEIVTGTDTGGGPHVQIFGGDGRWLGTFFAYDTLFRGGVRLAIVGDTIVTAAGPGGGPHVRVFNNLARVVGGFFTDNELDRNGITIGSY